MQSKKKLVILTAFVSLVSAAACANTATCDPDEALVDDLCLPLPSPAPAADGGVPDAQTKEAGKDAPDSGKISADSATHSESQ
jgi:hypothetical protein